MCCLYLLNFERAINRWIAASDTKLLVMAGKFSSILRFIRTELRFCCNLRALIEREYEQEPDLECLRPNRIFALLAQHFITPNKIHVNIAQPRGGIEVRGHDIDN